MADARDSTVDLVRRAMPVTTHCRYLNTGSLGPVSTVYAECLRRVTGIDVEQGRAREERYEKLDAARERLRAEVASLVHAQPAQIVLTQGTRQGLEAILDEFCWRAGDEIVTTNLEHATCAVPLRRVAARLGLRLRIAECPREEPDDLCWLTDHISSRTRLLALSAVAYETGYRLPIERIGRLAVDAQVRTLVDAAQCAGAAPLNVEELGIDYCAVPMQKWLCGPEGLGALYVREGAAEELEREPRDAVVHGHGILAASAAQMAWQRETIGWNWILARTMALADHARALTRDMPNVRLVTPASHAGLVTIAPEGTDTQRVYSELSSRAFIVRHLPELQALRISTAYFNTTSEIDALATALSALT